MSQHDDDKTSEVQGALEGGDQGGLPFVGPGGNPPAEGAYLTLPTSQTDVARRYLEDMGETEHPLVAAHVNAGAPKSYETETTDTTHYVGVSDEYMTHADDRQRPYAADGGVEEAVERKLLADENFGYAGQVPTEPSNPTVGGGSYGQHIVPGTSGEAVSGLRVEAAPGEDGDAEPAGTPVDDAGRSEAPKVKAQRAPAKGTDKEASAST